MARAAVIPQSPPKQRTTRTRTKGSTTTTSTKPAPKTTKAKAPSSATEARKRGARVTSVATSKPVVVDDESDESTDDEIGMVDEKEKMKTTVKSKGRPATKPAASTAGRGRKTATATKVDDLESDNDDELAQSDAPKKRAGRPRAKPVSTPAKPETAPKGRGRPKGSAATKAAKPVDPVKENTRLNAKGFTDLDFSSSQNAPRRVYIATNSTTSNARSNMLRGPAKKKKVTFQDPSDSAEEESSEPSPPAAGRRRGTVGPGRQAGLASKPVRKPAATSGRGRKPAAKKDGPKPLSPKKATQVAKALSSYANSDSEDDELSGDKDQVKFVVDSPQKHGSEKTGLISPVKKINLTGKFRKSLDENGEPLPGPRRSIDFNDTLLMSSPARRPPPSPFNFSIRETPKRGGFAIRDDAKQMSQPHLSPTHNSPLKLSPRKAHLETPKRGSIFLDGGKSLSQPNFTPGHNSPLKSSPRKGLFGAAFTSQAHAESTSTPLRHSVSFLQSPAKRVASPFKSSLFASRSTIEERPTDEQDANVDVPATPDVEESPLRMTDFERRDEVESEDEQVDSEVPEEVDALDTTKELHAQSPAVAEFEEEETLHGEFDREETIEFEQEDNNVAEDLATQHKHTESDVQSDQDAEEPVEPMDEPLEHPMEHPEELMEDSEEPMESTEEPTETPMADPVEDPMDDLVEEHVEESVQEPMEESVEEPTEEPIKDPVDEPMEEPMDDLIEETMESAGTPTVEPTDDPIELPIEEHMEAPTAEPVEEPIEDPVESDEELVEEAAADPIEPVTEPVAKHVEESDPQQVQSTVEDQGVSEESDVEQEVEELPTEQTENIAELVAEPAAEPLTADDRESTEEIEDTSVEQPNEDLGPEEEHAEVHEAGDEASVTSPESADEQTDAEAQEDMESEVDEPELRNAQNPGLRHSLVEGLEDVFVEHTAPEPVADDYDASETEDDPDMLEAGDENAADDFDDLDDDVSERHPFDDSEPTLVGFEATERIPPNPQPILPYEVEEPEGSFSPTRQMYYTRRVLSPVRFIDSPVRLDVSPVPLNLHDPAAEDSQNEALENVNLPDPFVESRQATPRRRSTRRLVLENAPRFTPMAQYFSQWTANSPAKAHPKRPRRGVFSLGGRKRSSNVASASEVSYPDVSSQAQSSLSELSMPEASNEAVPDIYEYEQQEQEPQSVVDDAEVDEESSRQPMTDAMEDVEAPVDTSEADVPEIYEDKEQEQEQEQEPQSTVDDAEVVDANEAQSSSSELSEPPMSEASNEADVPEIYEDKEQDQESQSTVDDAEVVDKSSRQPMTEVVGDVEAPVDTSEAGVPEIHEVEEQEQEPQPTVDDAEVADANEAQSSSSELSELPMPEASNEAVPEIYEDEQQEQESQPIADDVEVIESPRQPTAEVAEDVQAPVLDTSEADVPEIYEDKEQDQESQSVADDAEVVESPRQPMAEVVEDVQPVVGTSQDKENNQEKVASVPDSPIPVSEPHAAPEPQAEDKENGNIPVLAPFTPMKNRISQMQTVHTVSKVPLKPEGEISPLKISRKRGLSFSAPSPGRSARPRMSTFAPVEQNAPSFSPRKSPRLQRAAARQSLDQSQAPDTTKKPVEAQMTAPHKRPRQSPSPKKKSKTPRTSISAPQLALKGAVVYVDVHTTEGEDASGIFIELLQQMGARCVKNWSWNPRASVSPEEGTEPKEGKVGITHVIYKDGGVRTLEKVRHARGLVKCVGVGWVLDCERENKWLGEAHYEVDLSIIPRGGAKRRKSMEPRALSNVNGTLVKADAATASANRRRSVLPPKETTRDTTPSARDSPATPEGTPKYGAGYTEADQDFCHTPKTPGYTLDMDAIGMSPATPFYLSQRTRLVQQTCPPKQTRQGLFTSATPVHEPNQKLRAKLEAARRKSMAYKPRVGSPLVD
ncbi:hypothetical protein BO78DRAFT_471500 [Aspergillus sclerotiicarbonarius CBS 121057]|uniref:BRCT domain-containing protein n=1 Tax=Aspergillus sclerotiicarbonarius (strain CBS 121057 / IBT 28362) TaxID=1448318 RepID=A0A319E3R5_ASPSB|nr:hypothetical protein BO78DRAFT_471500 [Aspergillus sclerotiicarbonarius CBS 121057]